MAALNLILNFTHSKTLQSKEARECDRFFKYTIESNLGIELKTLALREADRYLRGEIKQVLKELEM